MTIRTPTSLVIDFNTDLKTEIANNKFVSHRLITNSLQMPVGSYTVGSIDITNGDSDVFLGHAGAGVILSDKRINVTLGQSTPIITKLFAYDGVKMPISVSTDSLTPITVEYAIGDKVPVMSSAPTITGVTAGDASALVAFSVPTDNGGSVITGYTVTSHPGNITATGTVSPINVTGLTNATPYTFTIVATNSAGDSVASTASAPATPILSPTVPGAPTITGLASSGRSVTVSVSPPANNGGRPITSYIAFSHPSTISGESTTPSITVNNLVYGTEYNFTVIAVNAIGPSLHSTASNLITLETVPGAPTITNVVPGDSQATISFTPPTSNGGRAITHYSITSNQGGEYSVAGGETSDIIPDLTNGTEYIFTVTAHNVVGAGAPSVASVGVTPFATSGAPTITNVVAGDTQATVTFTPPTNLGSGTFDYYKVIYNPGGSYTTGATSPIIATELTNGTSYTFTVVAVTSVGDGTPSAASNSVTPVGLPDAPIMISASSADGSATVTFDPPVNDGGAAISVYRVTSTPGGIVATGYNSPILITTLTNETPYTFTVAAVNSAGTGASSAASNSVTPAAA